MALDSHPHAEKKLGALAREVGRAQLAVTSIENPAMTSRVAIVASRKVV